MKKKITPTIPEKPYFVYVVSDGNGAVKIGLSSRLMNRFDDLQNSNASSLTLHLTIRAEDGKAARKIELFFHDRYRDYRASGEWFRIDPRWVCFDIMHYLMAIDEYESLTIHDMPDPNHNLWLTKLQTPLWFNLLALPVEMITVLLIALYQPELFFIALYLLYLLYFGCFLSSLGS